MVLSTEARPDAASDGRAPGGLLRELDRIAAVSGTKIGTENFPVAMRVLPATPRDHLRRAYAFARFVDDVGDEAAGDRAALLDAVDRDVQNLDGGTPALGPVRGLAPLIGAHGLPLQPLRNLIEANRCD